MTQTLYAHEYFFHMNKWKKSYTHLYVEHVYNSSATLWNSGEEGREKRRRVNHIEMHYICAGRGHNDLC
jgi:hypothetical protein